MESPWVIRLEEEVKSFVKTIEQKLKSNLLAIKKYPLEVILKRAISQKKYDIYHSTTIEGYIITPEEVEAVILGTKSKGRESFEQLRNKMAIIGYAHAFEYIIDKIRKNFRNATISDY
jgi:hypothetical protein